MMVKISENERDFLESKADASEFLAKIESSKGFQTRLLLELTPDEADDLREICSEWLQKEGFDSNYALTESGRICESLIDKLFVP